MKRGWWRTNRYWLPVVPLALVAMLAASSYHVKEFWYLRGLHHAVAVASPGRSVPVDIPYTDSEGRTAYRFRVRLDGLTEVDHVTDSLGEVTGVPAGATAYQVRMSFAADPGVALSGCQVSVVDSQGNEYDDALDQGSMCVPPDHPGPEAAVFRGTRRGEVAKGEGRPPTWSRAPVLLVAKGARPTEVRVWFARPDYVELPVPR